MKKEFSQVFLYNLNGRIKTLCISCVYNNGLADIKLARECLNDNINKFSNREGIEVYSLGNGTSLFKSQYTDMNKGLPALALVTKPVERYLVQEEYDKVIYDLETNEEISFPFVWESEFAVPMKMDNGTVLAAGYYGVYDPRRKAFADYQPFHVSDKIFFNIKANRKHIFISGFRALYIYNWKAELVSLFQFNEYLSSTNERIRASYDRVIATAPDRSDVVLTREGILKLASDGTGIEEFLHYTGDFRGSRDVNLDIKGFLPQKEGLYGVLVVDSDVYKVDLETGGTAKITDVDHLEQVVGEEASTSRLSKNADAVFIDECSVLLWSRAFHDKVIKIGLC